LVEFDINKAQYDKHSKQMLIQKVLAASNATGHSALTGAVSG
jgi:hypothetical protein